TTQGTPMVAELINDAWFEGVAAAYMGGFAQDECWASTFVPETEHYPFTVDAIRLLIGGTDDGTGDFNIGLWSVDANNRPETELVSAVVELTGVNKDIDFVLLGPAGIDSPVFDEGNFAIVGCLVSHAGYPAIAADTNGQVDYPDRNWIRTTDGEWTQSAGLGVGGDWVMRAFILPEG
ncbi:MAG: hypothetical protein JKY37_10870, partial [Nannocystaceae bacterium]|nr:hypothetical protein [Nannocystaceae bacterium]